MQQQYPMAILRNIAVLRSVKFLGRRRCVRLDFNRYLSIWVD